MIPADSRLSSIAQQQDTNLRRTQEQNSKRLLLVLALLHSKANLGKDCLQSLFFLEMHSRENDIADATDDTCAWLLRHPEYTTWLGRDRELLWIKGKPGAGKSTLLRHALRDAKLRADDKACAPADKLVVASFFFHARGSPMQKSPLGMFRSLLHQVLCQIPESLSELTSDFTRKCERQGRAGEQWEWHEAELRTLFKDSIAEAKKTYSIEIYVDALDECGEETAKDLVADFQSLISTTTSCGPKSLKVCFSCRLYPIMKLECGRSICVDKENDHDIRTYVGVHLGRGISESSKVQEIQEEIIKKARGNFQWVSLVIPEVLKSHKKGRNMNAIRGDIRKIPSELSDLYRKLLEDIPEDERPQSLLLMQWIFFAFRPLSLTELRFAMAITPDSPYKSLGEMKQNSTDYAETDDAMDNMVKNLSRGLTEVLKDGSGRRIVQFNHQSVNDYLFSSGFRNLGSPEEFSVLGRAHFQLSRSCIKHITMAEVRHSTMDNINELRTILPLLDYATEYWMKHAKIVEAESTAQDDLLSLFAWPSDHVLEYLINKHGRKSFIGMTLLHIASEYGFRSTVKAILSSLENSILLNSMDGRGRTPLSRAAQDGHKEIVKLLLGREGIEINSQDQRGRTPLSYAAQDGHEEIVKLLLGREDIEINSQDQRGRTPLSHAAEDGHEEIVKLLLEREDIEINSQDQIGRTPPSYAAEYGYEGIVELLLEREDIEINSQDQWGKTPLSHAAEYGNEGIVELLLEREDIEINSQDQWGRTPLSYAAEYEHEGIVKLLLKREDIEINSQDQWGMTPLSYAIQERDHVVAEQLQQKLRERGEVDELVGCTPDDSLTGYAFTIYDLCVLEEPEWWR
jgi:ankyrin repeat protein